MLNALLVAWTLYWNADRVMREQLKERLKSIATISAMQFTSEEVESIHVARDRRLPVFVSMVERMKAIRNSAPGIVSVYILRPSQDPQFLVFVADADSLNTVEESDTNNNGTLEPHEIPANPGDFYDTAQAPDMLNGFLAPTTDSQVTIDQWGKTISGYAPIYRRGSKEAIAIIGIDMGADEFTFRVQSILPPFAIVLLLLGTGALAAYIAYMFTKRRLEEWKVFDKERAGLMLLTFHQLGAPLTIFKWSVEALQNRTSEEPLEDAVAEHVENMQQGIRRMDEMINDLKFAAQVQEGRVDMHIEQVDLKNTVLQVVESFKQNAEGQGVELVSDVPHSILGHTDPLLVQDVLHQLITNAINYSHRGGQVFVRARKLFRNVQFEVADTGAGIPPEDMKRLFGKFMRGSNAPRYKPDGNGLGLFIARGLTETLGGSMSVRSSLDKGTTVTFTIPLH